MAKSKSIRGNREAASKDPAAGRWDPRNPLHIEEFGREIDAVFDKEEQWWQGLPLAEKNRLRARAEEYRDLHDFLTKYHGLQDETAYASWIGEQLKNHIVYLFADYEALRADTDLARRRRDAVCKILRSYLDDALGLKGKQPSRELSDRFREWSRRTYLGEPPKQLIQGTPYDESYVRVNVSRHRRRRQSLDRYICRTIWEHEQRAAEGRPTV